MIDLPEPDTEIGGKYRIIRLLGQGGMGAVFEAENTRTLKRVAVKWVHPELSHEHGSSARLMREALAAGRVRHPNVVDIYDVLEEDGAAFLVMEYLEGEPLTSVLARGNLELHTMIALLVGAMRGVAAAHRYGVIHRDIKPDNILLCTLPDIDTKMAKVLDFGIAKVEARGPQLTTTRPVTLAGSTLGTPMYMSYEQLTQEEGVDGRADVYAFGVILYQALTGCVPYQAATLPELMVQIATTEPEPVAVYRPDVPAALSEAVARAMAKRRDHRLPNLDAMIAALEPFATRDGLCPGVPDAEIPRTRALAHGSHQPADGGPDVEWRQGPASPALVDVEGPTVSIRDQRPPAPFDATGPALAPPEAPKIAQMAEWGAPKSSIGQEREPRSLLTLLLLVVGVAAGMGSAGGMLLRSSGDSGGSRAPSTAPQAGVAASDVQHATASTGAPTSKGRATSWPQEQTNSPAPRARPDPLAAVDKRSKAQRRGTPARSLRTNTPTSARAKSAPPVKPTTARVVRPAKPALRSDAPAQPRPSARALVPSSKNRQQVPAPGRAALDVRPIPPAPSPQPPSEILEPPKTPAQPARFRVPVPSVDQF